MAHIAGATQKVGYLCREGAPEKVKPSQCQAHLGVSLARMAP